MVRPRILFVDNFDSFTYNVAHLFIENGAEVDIVLNDAVRSQGSLEDYDGVLLGPGPGKPSDAPGMMETLRAAVERRTPVFGVCLGLQAIGVHFGAKIIHTPSLMHGKTSEIWHTTAAMFAQIPRPFTATRYHSLCIDESTLPEVLEVTARSEDGLVQALAHRKLPVHGVQFHPESILSEHGDRIAKNFLRALVPKFQALHG